MKRGAHGRGGVAHANPDMSRVPPSPRAIVADVPAREASARCSSPMSSDARRRAARSSKVLATSLAAAQLASARDVARPHEQRVRSSATRELEGVRLLPWSAVEGSVGDAIDTTSLIKVLDDAAEIDDVVLLVGRATVRPRPKVQSSTPLVDGVLVSVDPRRSVPRRSTPRSTRSKTMGGEVAGVVVSPVPARW